MDLWSKADDFPFSDAAALSGMDSLRSATTITVPA